MGSLRIGSNILRSPNPISPTNNRHLETRLRHEPATYNTNSRSRFSKYPSPSHTTPKKSYGAGFDQNSIEYKICVWLQSHNVWFNDKTGNKLMSVLIESGITEPDTELRLLKEWPDLIQISDAAVKSIYIPCIAHHIFMYMHILFFMHLTRIEHHTTS